MWIIPIFYLARAFVLPVLGSVVFLLGAGYAIWLFARFCGRPTAGSAAAFLVVAVLTALLAELTVMAWNADPVGGSGYF